MEDLEQFETGKVLSVTRNHGFVSYEGKGIFFFFKDVVGGKPEFMKIRTGDTVRFLVSANEKGLFAHTISKLTDD